MASLLKNLNQFDFIRSVLGIILGGGAGTRLYPLTKKRNPVVPLGANYHLIDIPISNCLNSNISKIYVLTQFNSASLNRHLSRAYASNIGGYKNEGFVEVLAAQQSPENPNWFQEFSPDGRFIINADRDFKIRVIDDSYPLKQINY
ncbi:hypothetical protein HYC85_011103 [Camellia sinensis]|uniref:glucose-1-phosphate adenylyltransferase n=1 Tax=Camellia sinensis TaxID=4442 RepID=A0A7J7HKD4_CAMSI|nr:hypothetical protein HYC85_011103 [Camellia sinensis]